MRADIHDGPEHMLQSEAGYIDARPLTPARQNLLQRTAGPYIWVKSYVLTLACYFRSTPINGHCQAGPVGQVRARYGNGLPALATMSGPEDPSSAPMASTEPTVTPVIALPLLK